jgi:segregation and condensation protein B
MNENGWHAPGEGAAVFAATDAPAAPAAPDAPDPHASASDAGTPDAPDPHASAPDAGTPAALARIVEALLFLSSDPLTVAELADATESSEADVRAALAALSERHRPGQAGIRVRELGGGFTLASDPEAEPAARRLFSRVRLQTLTPAQAETLAIVCYLQPVSRPEIARIRGVSAESATATLLDRDLIEEAGSSQFGATLYRTTTRFLKLFGMRSLEDLPEIAQWDPTPEEEADLRERLLAAGDARATTS